MLIDFLQEYHAALTTLSQVLNQEKACFLARHFPDIFPLLEQKKALLTALSQYKTQLENLVQEANLPSFSAYLDTLPTELRQQSLQYYQRIRQLIALCDKQNTQNGIFLRSRLHTVESFLHLIQHQSLPETIGYTRLGDLIKI